VTCIHPTCKNKIQTELLHIKDKIKDEELRRKQIPSNLTIDKYGKAVQNQTNNKHRTYTPLLEIANKQTLDGFRDQNPTFLAVAITTNGEFGPETIKTIEIITKAYAHKCTKEKKLRHDGRTVEELTASFRNKLRDSLQIAVAKGLSRMITTAGWPVSSCKKNYNQSQQ